MVCSASCLICERSPSSIHSLSPRAARPNQTLLSVFSARADHAGAFRIQQRPSAGSSGACPSSRRLHPRPPLKESRPATTTMDWRGALEFSPGKAERSERHHTTVPDISSSIRR